MLPIGALDAGAHGIMVPLIKTASDARYVVDSAKFPPKGGRGFGSPLYCSTSIPFVLLQKVTNYECCYHLQFDGCLGIWRSYQY